MGGQAADYLDGAAGNDSILGVNATDEIVGGAGDDVIFGDEGGYHGHPTYGDDWILAGDGNDWIDGENGSDTVFGGAGDDVFITVDSAIDVLLGDGGRDSAAAVDAVDLLTSIEALV